MPAKEKKGKGLWFKDAIIYELSVRAFFDSNGDGIGDFPGLIQKLDYLEDLGINTLWLLPFYPSPLRDDGYDVTDHNNIHPDYGTLSDFRAFVKEAHRRNIRVITDLILNHTSDQHPWFKKSRESRQGSRARDYYVWSDNPEKYADARTMQLNDENSNWTWDPVARSYYWHRFSRYMPELNYENPEVQMEAIRIADFWLKAGVDGFRLSSIPFLYEQEGTGSENLPQTHAFVKKLRTHIDKNFDNRILIAEANLWPEDAASYFGKGDECHMSFHYPLMPRLFLALRTEDNYPIVDIIEQTPDIPDTGQWALFLRNHDELGLEMVTDEEKDFLLKAYSTDTKSNAQSGINRRLAPLLNNDRRKIELLHALIFSLPGSPVMYYGDEIGMGDNVYLGGRLGVRTPMQWDMNINAGFSSANPQKLYLPVITDPVYRHEFVNVKTQEESPSSLLWWMKHIITMRKRLNAFGHGDMKFIESTNSKLICFARSYEDQRIIVVANLSQFSQAATLNLSAFRGCDVTEAFSQNRFKSIDRAEYDITIGPYGYFWFQVDVSEKRVKGEASGELPLIESDLSWERIFHNYNEVRKFERKVWQPFLNKCRWFVSKAKVISKITFHKIIPLRVEESMHYLTILEVHFVHGLPELYFLPVTFVLTDRISESIESTIQSLVCRAEIQDESGFIIDSTYDKAFRDHLFASMAKNLQLKEGGDELEFKSSLFAKLNNNREINSKLLKSDQSNTAIIYNDAYFLKFFRKIEKEINPDLEVIRFLSENTNFQNSPKYTGSIELREGDNQTYVFGLMQEKVEHQGDAWTMTVDSLGRFYERVIMSKDKENLPGMVDRPVLKFEEAPVLIQELIGRGFYERMVRLGQRTAELHIALASNDTDPSFAPEGFTKHYQRSMYSSLRKLVRDKFSLLENSLSKIDPNILDLAKRVLSREDDILTCFSEIHQVKIESLRTRIHGDYHLGQVLYTGNDFVIIDFEGEPGLSFNERRVKKSPLKDVAGMMRSIHYAAFGKLLLNVNYRDKDLEILERWAEQWQHYINRFYLGAYMELINQGNFSAEHDVLIRTFLLEKAIYELGYELNARPDWVAVPLRGIDYLMTRYLNKK